MPGLSWWGEPALLAVHLLCAAAWFGALVYRTLVVNVRAKLYFQERERDYEEFLILLTDGARYVVLAALLVGGLSGALLLGLRWQRTAEATFAALMAGKAVVYGLLFAGFVYVSWWMWPRRVFAAPDEFAREQRHAQRVAYGMLALLTVAMLLGVASGRG